MSHDPNNGNIYGRWLGDRSEKSTKAAKMAATGIKLNTTDVAQQRYRLYVYLE